MFSVCIHLLFLPWLRLHTIYFTCIILSISLVSVWGKYKYKRGFEVVVECFGCLDCGVQYNTSRYSFARTSAVNVVLLIVISLQSYKQTGSCCLGFGVRDFKRGRIKILSFC